MDEQENGGVSQKKRTSSTINALWRGITVLKDMWRSLVVWIQQIRICAQSLPQSFVDIIRF